MLPDFSITFFSFCSSPSQALTRKCKLLLGKRDQGTIVTSSHFSNTRSNNLKPGVNDFTVKQKIVFPTSCSKSSHVRHCDAELYNKSGKNCAGRLSFSSSLLLAP
jgi:hypothetical protein